MLYSARSFLGVLVFGGALSAFAACGIDTTNDARVPTSTGSGASDATASSAVGSGGTGTSSSAGIGGTSNANASATASASVGSGGGFASGTIACGAQSCTVGSQICCTDSSGSSACVDAATGCPIQNNASITDATLQCDDSSDCAAVCCVALYGEHYAYACASVCVDAAESCVLGKAPEPCKIGICTPDPNQVGTFAKCDPKAAIACDGAECSGPTPVCCATSSGATCTAIDGCTGNGYSCASSATCGAELCCATANGSECAANCPGTALCSTVDECPVSNTGAKATACAAPSDGSLPAGLMSCAY